MKIGLLSFEYPPETGFGGIGTYTWYQARALARLGHEVHVLAGATEPTPLQVQEHDGVTVFRYRPDGLLMRSFARIAQHRLCWTRLRLENAVSMLRGLKALMRRHRYDLLEMPECGAEGCLINFLVGTTTIVRLHSPSRLIMPYYQVRQADMRLCSALERLAIIRAKALSSCSHFLAREAKLALGIKRPVRVIPNGIDLSLFDRDDHWDAARVPGLPPGRVMILFAGRMEQRKGIHLCLEIAAAILERYDVAFVFAGQDLFGFMSGTLLPFLAKRRLRGTVHYLGKLDQRELRCCMRRADIFLLPSLWENCPYSCLEAMAAGRAIVSSDQGGMPEMIRDGKNGLLATCGVAGSFVARIQQLIESAELRGRLGRAARSTLEECYTDSRIARLSSDFYAECIDGTPSSHRSGS